MQNIYSKLNDYLNDICVYLQEENSILLDNMPTIILWNDTFLKDIQKYHFNIELKENHLTYEDVFLIAREIIATISKSYLKSFDNLISSGELDFSYEQSYTDSNCQIIYNQDQIHQSININREFNCNDVITLIHEFIHYTNTNIKEISDTQNYLEEFLSIYFELYSVDPIIKKGILESNDFKRILITKKHASTFCNYEIPLLSFIYFGPINNDTPSLLHQYFPEIKTTYFKKECMNLYTDLNLIEQKYQIEIAKNPNLRGKFLSEEFITKNYKYVLGALLAIYALKYSKIEDMVSLNNQIHEYTFMNASDILKKVGIDITKNNFYIELFQTLKIYLNKDYELSLHIP